MNRVVHRCCCSVQSFYICSAVPIVVIFVFVILGLCSLYLVIFPEYKSIFPPLPSSQESHTMQWQLRMVLVAAVAARAQQRFLTEPGDVTVIAGQRVGLYCIMFQCNVEL